MEVTTAEMLPAEAMGVAAATKVMATMVVVVAATVAAVEAAAVAVVEAAGMI